MPSRRTSSVISVILLALAWICGSVALAEIPTSPGVHQAEPPGVDIGRFLLSGSGSSAALAVLIWTKLTSQDREIAELKSILKSRPCVLPDRSAPPACEECSHRQTHRRDDEERGAR